MMLKLFLIILAATLIFGVPIYIDGVYLDESISWIAGILMIYGMITTRFIAVYLHEIFPKKPDERCQSCRNGYDGRNGNGYQPCSCKNQKPKGDVLVFSPKSPLTEGSMQAKGGEVWRFKSNGDVLYRGESIYNNPKLPKYEEDLREEFDDDDK
jgi:hypothetical protein